MKGIEGAQFDDLKLNSETIDRIPPDLGGTSIVMQRHGKYERETGSLTESGEEISREKSTKIIDDFIDKIPEDERKKLVLMVLASPTELNGGQRSMETAKVAIDSARKVFEKYGIPEGNILTTDPRPVEDIEEPRIFKENLDYMNFLFDKYGKGTQSFWKAFEEDVHKDERLQFGAEGPVDMSDRYAHFIDVLGRYSRQFHAKNQEDKKRLIIWVVSHYDTITTYIKNHVANIPQEKYVPVDYDGGVTMNINPENEASIQIGDTKVPVELSKQGNITARVKNQEK